MLKMLGGGLGGHAISFFSLIHVGVCVFLSSHLRKQRWEDGRILSRLKIMRAQHLTLAGPRPNLARKGWSSLVSFLVSGRTAGEDVKVTLLQTITCRVRWPASPRTLPGALGGREGGAVLRQVSSLHVSWSIFVEALQLHISCFVPSVQEETAGPWEIYFLR